MSQSGRIAVRDSWEVGFRIAEYPVPEPEPGAMLVKISMANISGSNMHSWRGDSKRSSRRFPRNDGHEGTGTVAALGEGVAVDGSNQPLHIGDRVIFSLFYPCGRCRACLKGKEWCCP